MSDAPLLCISPSTQQRMSFPDPSTTKEISVTDAAAIIDQGEVSFLLIDCREPNEFEICSIEGADLAPLSNFEMEIETLFIDEDDKALIYCHHGARSLQAVEFLRKKGYNNTFSITGGIDAWAQEIDTELARY